MLCSDSFVRTLSLFVIVLCVWNQQYTIITTTHAELVACVVLPHGDFAFDPKLLPFGSRAREAANKVSVAAHRVGHWLNSTIQPDIIILSTPHGMELTYDFAFYLGSFASGYANIGEDLRNSSSGNQYRVNLERILLAPNATRELLNSLHDQAVSGILNFADSEDMALRWGEVVPLLLVEGAADNPSSSLSSLRYQQRRSRQRQRRKHIILSHPLRRYDQASSMIPELLKLGRSIRHWADSRPERIAILISADLSHTHRLEGPYGYSNASAIFDAAVGKWANDPVANEDALLRIAASLQSRAMACGFTGLVMLHGAIRDDVSLFESNMLANYNATYYGMMVATFLRRKLLSSSIV